jgi:hypothetical protein
MLQSKMDRNIDNLPEYFDILMNHSQGLITDYKLDPSSSENDILLTVTFMICLADYKIIQTKYGLHAQLKVEFRILDYERCQIESRIKSILIGHFNRLLAWCENICDKDVDDWLFNRHDGYYCRADFTHIELLSQELPPPEILADNLLIVLHDLRQRRLVYRRIDEV